MAGPSKDTKYNVYCKGTKIHSNLSQDDYFEIMQDLAVEFYTNGSPGPEEITTELIEE
jgi:hypothetical protein